MSVTIRKDGKYTLKNSEELFNEWRILSRKIELLGGLHQNDMEVTGAQLQEFVEACGIAQKMLKDMVNISSQYIAKNLEVVPEPFRTPPQTDLQEDPLPDMDEEVMAEMVWEDMTDGDKIHKEKVTRKQYETMLRVEGAAITILKHPSFPGDK